MYFIEQIIFFDCMNLFKQSKFNIPPFKDAMICQHSLSLLFEFLFEYLYMNLNVLLNVKVKNILRNLLYRIFINNKIM